MNKKLLILLPICALVVACGEIPTISEGPRSDENLLIALNEVNFINYIIQSKQKNVELGEYYTIATISPLDLSFKTKTKQLLFTTEHSSYYFDKVDDSYDIYYKDKFHNNHTYLGNSYYGRYNRTDIIEGIPTLDDIFNYYHVHNLTRLDPLDFTYNTHLNGWYILNEDAYSDVMNDFFGLSSAYTLHHLNLQLVSNKVRSIEYKMMDENNIEISNELFYTYPLDYLQESQFSLINTLKVTRIDASTIVPTSSEVTSEIISEVTSDITSEVTSEITSETPSDTTSEAPTTSEEPTTSEPPITSEPPTSEDIEYVDRIEFSIYDDAKLFGDNKYTIESIQLYENFDYDSDIGTPIYQIDAGSRETVTERQFTLDGRLNRGVRYLLRINIGDSPDGQSTDFYDYSWIYS